MFFSLDPLIGSADRFRAGLPRMGHSDEPPVSVPAVGVSVIGKKVLPHLREEATEPRYRYERSTPNKISLKSKRSLELRRSFARIPKSIPRLRSSSPTSTILQNPRLRELTEEIDEDTQSRLAAMSINHSTDDPDVVA
jgi:hypothetical protein